ncbi:BrnT family toxin [Methylocucumis oryzae]|uniref:Membrane protein n=1 Tax=Methylocucumis oryzae TaxID=1632867 RepID=A0A0F3IEL7_9GAMM|nr:BrnT family toxin [Methylocucumis oryzae]KJV05107.1 membrane protein [Methylocucumis oryzae]
MIILWDENKNIINQSKHRISFELAQRVFDDPLHISRQDRIENDELRWQTLGLVNNVVLLLVAHSVSDTNGEETIRIISARKADKTERRIYEQGQ